ncbi:MAG: aminotransferase class I/II-fold pyridoxal phosphate-dependent enzyme [Ilumatobacteraceae bacterium]
MSRRAGALEASGRRVLHLEVGQPSTPLPELAREAVRRHLDEPLGYTNAAGLRSLRQKIAARYTDVDPRRVVVVAGASAGFTLAFLTMFEPGDRVGVLEPGYPCYRNTLIALGMVPVPIPVGPDSRWAPTVEHLDAAGHLDGIILASPSNPTGTVLSTEALTSIASACRERGIVVIADEIYHGIVQGPPAPQMLDVHPEALLVNSFSKYWSMTGWRIGWLIVPESVVDTVERLQQNLYVCAPHVAQVAAEAALDADEELEGHVARYRENRTIILAGLAEAGIVDIAPADGAFYVYAHVPHLTTELGIDSLALTNRWLDELGVAATSGIDFDLARGHEYVRFSYAGTGDDMADACALLAGWAP